MFEQKLNTLRDALENISARFIAPIFATSLSIEDMVITDQIFRHELSIKQYSIDTDRLPGDTYLLNKKIEEHYGQIIHFVRGDPLQILAFTQQHGVDAMYTSVDRRKRCCALRKIEPLKKLLVGKDAWVTGLRRGQSESREWLAEEAFDSSYGIIKFNPLTAWSEDDVWRYLRMFNVPYSRLYDQGYRSIGCAPCTRPVLPSEHLRAGRWWWENAEAQECGLHLSADGRLQRVTQGKQ